MAQTADGWIGFDRFMALALYTPGLGYYANGSAQFGLLPQNSPHSGGDFATAPEISPLFGRALAAQIAQALQATQTTEVWEFGAGSGALALQVLDALAALGQPVERYTIVDLSERLQARQRHTLAAHANTVRWASSLPEPMHGVVIGNEVLDAMPVQLLVRRGQQWYERGVVRSSSEGKDNDSGDNNDSGLAWADRPTPLRPPTDIAGEHDYLTEIHAQGEAFVRTLGQQLQRGAVFLLDYGFPEAEYYHPQRHMGTVMCHRAHRADTDPLSALGRKDITAHVNFSAIALAAQDSGLDVLGYTSQAHFLLNCGIAPLMDNASLPQRAMAQKLLMEHEMGELFKAIGFVKGPAFPALGFAHADRTHRL